jgi:hypothetical protein
MGAPTRRHLDLIALLAALALSACGKSDLLGPQPTSESGADLDGDSDTDADSDTDTETGEEVICGWSELDVGADDSELEVDWKDVWGTSPEDVWVAGSRHDPYIYSEATIAHYDGVSWSVAHVDVGAADELETVWASSPSDVYSTSCFMVWGEGAHEDFVHFDGSTWTEVDVGVPFDHCIAAIWGRSADDVFVAAPVEAAPDELKQLLHFDGTDWQIVEEYSFGRLLDIWGVGELHLFGVGYDGLATRFDGSTWSVMETPTDEDLFSIWASSPNDVFAAPYFVESTEEALILHYDGNEWTQMEIGEPLRAVRRLWGLASDDVYAVGVWYDEVEEIYSNRVLRYDGTEWSEFYSAEQIPNVTDNLTGIWGSSATNVYVVGLKNQVLHYTCE